ncbi:MAG: alanine racemase [Capsulimonadaceae bacterium]
MTSDRPLRAWAEIDLAALAHNIAVLKALSKPAGVMAIAKADAYGHGIDIVAPHAFVHGIHHFGAATIEEAVLLRRLLGRGGAEVYLLSPVLPTDAPVIVQREIIPIVSSLDMVEALSRAAVDAHVTADVHVDIDTGIGRSGFQTTEMLDVLAHLDALPGLRLTGVFTHFASADEDEAAAHRQHARFLKCIDSLGSRADGLTVHASNSPASLILGRSGYHTLIRPGLLLYGIEPADGMFAWTGIGVHPVLSMRASVSLCRDLPEGATISYGGTYVVPSGGRRYATVMIGYGDGYPRRLGGGVGHVLLHGRRAPICGRICMDQCVVDVSEIPDVSAGDIATLIGRDGPEEITAAALAALIGTTPHEITTCLTARVPRVPKNM